MSQAVPLLEQLQAPPAWRTVDFISDLHLEAAHPQTVARFEQYLSHTPADAVVILGDLFEVWVGDDGLDDPSSFESARVSVIRQCADRLPIYFLHGNRDFLIGQRFAQAAQICLLADPCTLAFADQNWLLSHGDALCLADTEYMQFRADRLTQAWQQSFLSKPLAERRNIARAMRAQSEDRKQSTYVYADVDSDSACAWLERSHAHTLIHGHTHRPADHVLHPAQRTDEQSCYRRIVLSDWDDSTTAARAQVLRLSRAGSTAKLTRIDL